MLIAESSRTDALTLAPDGTCPPEGAPAGTFTPLQDFHSLASGSGRRWPRWTPLGSLWTRDEKRSRPPPRPATPALSRGFWVDLDSDWIWWILCSLFHLSARSFIYRWIFFFFIYLLTFRLVAALSRGSTLCHARGWPLNQQLLCILNCRNDVHGWK